MKTRHHFHSYIFLGVILALFLILPIIFPKLAHFSSPSFIRGFVLNFGTFSFIAYVVLVTISVPFNIPSTPVILAGGYIFGASLGMTLSLVGMILGSTLAFYITRIGGKLLLQKLVDPHHIKHFNEIFKKRGITAAFISYAIPVFPTDAVSLLLGLTSIHYIPFFFLVLLGHIPRLLIIISLGSNLQTGFTNFTIIAFLVAMVFVLIAVFRERIKRIIFAELDVFKKEVTTIKNILGNYKNNN